MSTDYDLAESLDSLPCPENWLVTHVPADIWRSIFKIHAAQYIQGPQHQRLKSLVLPLTWICSHWRKISTEAPELWNKIWMNIGHDGRSSLEPELLDLIVQRTGSMLLKISLDKGYALPKELPSATCGAILALFKNLHRAHELDIYASLFRLLPNSLLEDILQVGATSLRSLVLRAGYSQSDIDPRLSRIWTLSPNLRSVELDFEYSDVTNTLQIPFSQLASLDIGSSIPVSHLYNLLSNSKNLLECIVGLLPVDDDDDDDDEIELEPLVLPALEHLTIYAGDSLSFLGKLKTPALISLDMGNHEEWSHNEFASFLANSSCSILHFGVYISNADSEEKIESVRLLTQLTELTLRTGDRDSSGDFGCGEGFNANLLSKLKDWDKSRKEFSLLPRLQKITIDYAVLTYPGRSTLLADMVEDRGIAVKVTNVEIEFDRYEGGWGR